MESFDAQIQAYFRKLGYSVQTVSWEDCGRDKNSSFGACITDMTLSVHQPGRRHGQPDGQPVVRVPNFSDVTWDTDSDNYRLRVGDRMVSLKEYLDSIKPGLYLDRDKTLLTQTQCCALPVTGNDKVEFGIDVYTYSGSCLFVVASSHGTSHYLVTADQHKTLHHVNSDSKYWFTAKKMINEETKEAVTSYDEMNAKQRASNTITIFQIPIRLRSQGRGGGRGGLESCTVQTRGGRGGGRGGGMAEIGVGSYAGSYTKLDAAKLVRDERFSIRVTIQDYRVVNGKITESVADDIVRMLTRVDPHASAKGSLVVDHTDRPTETQECPATQPVDWDADELVKF